MVLLHSTAPGAYGNDMFFLSCSLCFRLPTDARPSVTFSWRALGSGIEVYPPGLQVQQSELPLPNAWQPYYNQYSHVFDGFSLAPPRQVDMMQTLQVSQLRV